MVGIHGSLKLLRVFQNLVLSQLQWINISSIETIREILASSSLFRQCQVNWLVL